MKTLAKIALSAVALALVSAPLAQAQSDAAPKGERRGPGGPGGPGGGNMAERAQEVAEQLGLTADQKTKFLALMKTQRDEMAKIRDEAGGDREKMQEKLRALRERNQAEVKAILTAEQFAKWQELMPQGGRRGGPGGGAPRERGE